MRNIFKEFSNDLSKHLSEDLSKNYFVEMVSQNIVFRPFRHCSILIRVSVLKAVNIWRSMRANDCKENSNKCTSKETREKRFECNECSKKFKTGHELKGHMLVHTVERMQRCSKNFKSSAHVKIHMRIHTEERRFVCSICSMKFLNKTNLKNHMLVHTEDRPFACSECSQKCKSNSALKQHMLVHNDKRPPGRLECKQCFKKFTDSFKLKRHMYVHAEDVFWMLPMWTKLQITWLPKDALTIRPCKRETFWLQRMFKKIKNERLSQDTHGRSYRKKKFACNECSKEFKSKSNLNNHMFVHATERPFKCNEGLKEFKAITGLNQHMLVHIEDRPFECYQCAKKCKSL